MQFTQFEYTIPALLKYMHTYLPKHEHVNNQTWGIGKKKRKLQEDALG